MMAWCALLRLCLPSVPGVELQGRWLMSGKSWLTLFSPALWPLFLHMDNISSFSSRRQKKRQSKHLSLCSGRQGLQPTQMEFILCSVIQSIWAQDVARRVEPKNASLKQLNFMLCIQLSLGLAETSSFHGFCNFCCSNELLMQWKGWEACGPPASRGRRRARGEPGQPRQGTGLITR